LDIAYLVASAAPTPIGVLIDSKELEIYLFPKKNAEEENDFLAACESQSTFQPPRWHSPRFTHVLDDVPSSLPQLLRPKWPLWTQQLGEE